MMEEVINQIDLNIDKSNWKLVKFGDVAFEPKEVCKHIQEEKIEHVVGLEHIDSGDIHLRKSASVEEATTFTKKFRKGDVLFGRRRAYLKKAAQADFDGICSGDITVFRSKRDLSPDLLPFIVHNEKFFDYAIKHSAGGLSPRVKFKDLANYEFLLPPKSEQARLAELLWAMDEVIEREREVLERLEVFNEVFCQYLLGLNGNKKNGWVKKSLKDVAPLQRGFDLPSTQLKEGDYPVGYSNGINFYHNEYKVNGPGVWTGRSGTIGNVFYTDENYWPHNTTLWVTEFNDNHPKFIYHLYSKLNFEKRMTGTGVPTLNRNDIHKFEIYLPQIGEQQVISKKIDDVELITSQTKEKIENSKALQKSLINQIF